MSVFQCSLPLSDLQAYGENLGLWSVPLDTNSAEHMVFPKILREQFFEYHSSSCATTISHCKEKWKLLLRGGELAEDRKKLTCLLIKDIWKYSLMILIYFVYNPCTKDYMETRALQTQTGEHACFPSWDFLIYVCANASGDKRNLFKHIYEN